MRVAFLFETEVKLPTRQSRQLQIYVIFGVLDVHSHMCGLTYLAPRGISLSTKLGVLEDERIVSRLLSQTNPWSIAFNKVGHSFPLSCVALVVNLPLLRVLTFECFEM